MENPLARFVDLVKQSFASKQVVGILSAAILLGAIPLTVFIAQQQQDIRQRASEAPLDATVIWLGNGRVDLTVTKKGGPNDTITAYLIRDGNLIPVSGLNSGNNWHDSGPVGDLPPNNYRIRFVSSLGYTGSTIEKEFTVPVPAAATPQITDNPSASPNTFTANQVGGRITICASGNDTNTDYIIAKLYKLGEEGPKATIGSTWDAGSNRCDEEAWPGGIGEGNYAIKFTPFKGTTAGQEKTVEPIRVNPGRRCAQVLTPARNNTTNECRVFSDSCIPEGWTVVTSCPGPTATPTPVAGEPQIAGEPTVRPNEISANTETRITFNAVGANGTGTEEITVWLRRNGALTALGSTRARDNINPAWEDSASVNLPTGEYEIVFIPTAENLKQGPRKSTQLRVTSALVPTATPTLPPGTTPTSTPTITLAPTATGVPGSAALTLDLNLGIGGGKTIKTQQRNIVVELYNSSEQLVGSAITQSNAVQYNSTTGRFTGKINLPNVAAGAYTVKIKTERYLRKRLPNIITVTGGTQTITIPQVALIAGDSTNNNILDIADYNMLINCFRTQQPSLGLGACVPTDLNDDGTIDEFDYNILIRNFSVRKGD